MKNSLVTHLMDYFAALFNDLAYEYSNQQEWKRDLSRLHSMLTRHGSRVATIELPVIGKALERSLDRGQLSLPNAFLCRRRKGTCIPIFMGNLFEQLFTYDGMLRDEPDARVVNTIRQIAYCCKKLRLTCAEELTFAEVSNFFSIEDDIKNASLPWGEDDLDVGAADGLHLNDADQTSLSLHGREAVSRFQRISDIVSSQFGDFHEESHYELPKHGPGVVSNLRRGESKYSFPEWPEKLSRIFPYDNYVWVDFDSWHDSHNESMSQWAKESPSRLIAVPKTQKGPRLIAAEPTQNQWIQQLILSQLSSRLKATSLSSAVRFESQMSNKVLALRGSSDGTFGTIDLSSASDRLSCWLVERVFRKNHSFLERLNASRTPFLSNSLDSKSPKLIRLKKFAAMGSACTFPVQSIVYALLAIAAIHPGGRVTSRSIAETARRVQVFGDDIIVPKDGFELTCELLAHFGLKVNQDKSFNTGLFRESCGTDAFAGVCVTPAYLLSPTMSVQTSTIGSMVEVANNHFAKGLWHTAKYLQSALSKYEHLLPISDIRRVDLPLSLTSFCGDKATHLKKRYNATLHREELRLLVPVTKQSEYETAGVHQLMKFFHEPSRPSVNFSKERVEDPIDRSLKTTGAGPSMARPGWGLINHPIFNPFHKGGTGRYELSSAIFDRR